MGRVRPRGASRLAICGRAIFLSSFAFGMARADIDLPLPPPPQPTAQTVTVFVGESVNVPLGGVSRTGLQLRFLIRVRPGLGTLSAVRNEDRNSAVVTYTSDASRGVGTDSFRYAVQAPNSGVSASAEVTVIVRERVPVFEAPSRLKFEDTALGESAVEILEMRNSGGGRVSGRLTVPRPWSLPEGVGTYSLGPGEVVRIAVRFAPGADRNYEGAATFSHDSVLQLGLSGRGFAPIQTAPLRVEMRSVDDSEVRSGSLTVRNVTNEAQELTIVAPKELVVQGSVEVGPGSESEVALHTVAGFLGALDGNISLKGESVNVVVPLTVSPAPARLVVRGADPDGGMDLGKPRAGETIRKKLVIRNVGGTEAKLSAQMPGSVRVTPEPTLDPLAAGAEREFELTFTRTLPGEIEEELILRGGAQPVRIGLTGEVVSTLTKGGSVSAVPAYIARTGPGYNTIPAVEEIGVTRLTHNEIDLAWTVPPGGVKNFVLYRRKIVFGEDGKARTDWQRVRDAKLETGEKTARAYLTGLAAGEQLTLAVIALDADGDESKPSPPFVLATKPPVAIRVPWTLVVILAFAVCVYVIVRERRRSRERYESEDAEVERRMRL